MKKILSITFALFACLLVRGSVVDRDAALRFAAGFFGLEDTHGLEVAWSGESGSASPAFYAINNAQGGFVLVSGEDSVAPVLGYSLQGRFVPEGMPVHIRDWFTSLETDIVNVRRLGLKASPATATRWKKGAPVTKAGGGVLHETAEWDQGTPYNSLCVLPNGFKAVTGCVATAMAILLRYNKYPEHGSGTLPSYTTSTNKYAISGYSIEDHYYDWDRMPLLDSDVKSASEEQKFQIAQLIHDCGVMVRMDYTRNSSGAITELAPDRLAVHMGYSAAARCFHKSLYTYSEWMSMIKDELDAGKILLYTGRGNAGGHAFIVDGYDAEGLLHVNWGWGGKDNAYYTLDLIVGDYRFSDSQTAILGVEPDPEKTKTGRNYVCLTGSGLSLASGAIGKDRFFSLNVNTLVNYGVNPYEGSVVAAVVDASGKVKETISSPVSVSIQGCGYNSYYTQAINIPSCIIKQEMDFTDRVTILATDTDANLLMPILYDREAGTIGYLTNLPDFIEVKPSYSVGERFEFSLISGGEPRSGITWYFDGKIIDVSAVKLTAGTHEVKAVISRSGGTEVIVQEITVN